MYLKRLSIKNYRKYGHETVKIDFAYSQWSTIEGIYEKDKEVKTENYISKSSSLIIGKNNSGKAL
ncbi:hypothetical protein [Staphylococcus pseudintermedius]|uniref:hypothetical protein n=1 Tax=Staphylococcus pseudintermedius TaxID=283734 RepID=UPI0028836CA8|nr:hypothetical protein [Staphylococcus pseudintermedius]EIS6531635.1 hypothetical protein [Staphylococcus pseudintermedius]MDT1038621.1 hypothetical protein [Staphylococcus pseudintermedius]